MALVGASLLVVSGVAALAGYRLLVVLWVQRPDPVQAVGVFLLRVVVIGHLTDRLGTAALLADLDTVELTRSTAPDVYARLDRLSDAFDIARPRLYAARMEPPNALAVGTAGRGALVMDGQLFRLLTPAELEAVMAHELAHLESRDGLLQTLGYTAVRAVGGLLYVVLLPVGLLVGGSIRAVAWLRGRPPLPFSQHLAVVRLRVSRP